MGCKAGVEPIELGRFDQAPRDVDGVGRQAREVKRNLEQVEVSVSRCLRQAGVTAELGLVEHLADAVNGKQTSTCGSQSARRSAKHLADRAGDRSARIRRTTQNALRRSRSTRARACRRAAPPPGNRPLAAVAPASGLPASRRRPVRATRSTAATRRGLVSRLPSSGRDEDRLPCRRASRRARMSRRLAEPVRRNRPGRRRLSTSRLIARSNSGARCTSSIVSASAVPSSSAGRRLASSRTSKSSRLRNDRLWLPARC